MAANCGTLGSMMPTRSPCSHPPPQQGGDPGALDRRASKRHGDIVKPDRGPVALGRGGRGSDSGPGSRSCHPSDAPSRGREASSLDRNCSAISRLSTPPAGTHPAQALRCAAWERPLRRIEPRHVDTCDAVHAPRGSPRRPITSSSESSSAMRSGNASSRHAASSTRRCCRLSMTTGSTPISRGRWFRVSPSSASSARTSKDTAARG